ncbi:uncharacterized protein LOC136078736 [Hydra vulgaris]|uniref:Uncharacterized protein LOC136078736 n=1 Tax=Hydra vulgaris TaxID=6087 RepID=A0ABM4BNE2_HYDVU
MEAWSLITYISDWAFILSIVIWYDILFQVNKTSKIIQSFGTSLDFMENEIRATEAFSEKYRENGFSSAEATARKIAEELNIPRIFPTICTSRKKKMFDYKGDDESSSQTPQSQFKNNFFFCACGSIVTVLCIKLYSQNSIHFLNYINSKCLQEVYFNVAIALRVLLTCPVAAATAIKIFHRSTMIQDRLSSLEMLSVEMPGRIF